MLRVCYNCIPECAARANHALTHTFPDTCKYRRRQTRHSSIFKGFLRTSINRRVEVEAYAFCEMSDRLWLLLGWENRYKPEATMIVNTTIAAASAVAMLAYANIGAAGAVAMVRYANIGAASAVAMVRYANIGAASAVAMVRYANIGAAIAVAMVLYANIAAAVAAAIVLNESIATDPL